jgi:hypothetical protein
MTKTNYNWRHYAIPMVIIIYEPAYVFIRPFLTHWHSILTNLRRSIQC